MLKKILIVLGVAALLVVLLIVFVFTKTAGMTDEADKFLEHVRSGKIAEAHAMTSLEFQKVANVTSLTQFLEANNLQNNTDASWSTRGFENDIGYIEGEVILASGGKLPMRWQFIEENNEWKILNMKPTIEGGFGGGNKQSTPTISRDMDRVPPAEICKQLSSRTLEMLVDALVRRDFKDFYKFTSQMWQSQTTPDELHAAFQTFIDNDISPVIVNALNNSVTITQQPSIDGQQTLNFETTYDGTPKTVASQQYISENGVWKLLGVSVNFK